MKERLKQFLELKQKLNEEEVYIQTALVEDVKIALDAYETEVDKHDPSNERIQHYSYSLSKVYEEYYVVTIHYNVYSSYAEWKIKIPFNINEIQKYAEEFIENDLENT
jgi:phage I-like protein